MAGRVWRCVLALLLLLVGSADGGGGDALGQRRTRLGEIQNFYSNTDHPSRKVTPRTTVRRAHANTLLDSLAKRPRSPSPVSPPPTPKAPVCLHLAAPLCFLASGDTHTACTDYCSCLPRFLGRLCRRPPAPVRRMRALQSDRAMRRPWSSSQGVLLPPSQPLTMVSLTCCLWARCDTGYTGRGGRTGCLGSERS